MSETSVKRRRASTLPAMAAFSTLKVGPVVFHSVFARSCTVWNRVSRFRFAGEPSLTNFAPIRIVSPWLAKM